MLISIISIIIMLDKKVILSQIFAYSLKAMKNADVIAEVTNEEAVAF